MSKRILLIQAHPDTSRPHLCHSLAASYAKGAEGIGHTVRHVILAKLDSPLLRSQQDWEEGSVVVFAWLVNRTAGSVVAALLLHTGINFWPSIIPVLPTGESHRPYGLLVAMLVLVALGLLVQPKPADPRSGALL